MSSLPNYPLPQLDKTVEEIDEVLRLCLDKTKYDDFLNELRKNMEYLNKQNLNFLENIENKENWATEIFVDRLLSLREPIQLSTLIPFLLTPSKVHKDHLVYASCLLWSTAKLKSDDSLIKNSIETTRFKGLILEETQQANIFSSCRIPNDEKDAIFTSTQSKHAVVFCRGFAFSVELISDNGQVLSLGEIYDQIKAIENYKCNGPESLICRLTSLRRNEWSKIRNKILIDNKDSLDLIESSIVTMTIEENDAPDDYAEAIKHVQFGDGTGNMRYYDKILSLIVYKNCAAGLLFEHTVVDGFLMYLISKTIYLISESQNIDMTNRSNSNLLKQIVFKFDNSLLNSINFDQNERNMSKTACFDFNSYEDLFNLFKEEKLYEIWINFSLQSALKLTFGNLNYLLATPTHVRHFKHGRSDPTYTITQKSKNFVDKLTNSQNLNDELVYSFLEAVKENKQKIRSTKLGHAIGPHIALLRHWLSNKNDETNLKSYLEKFGSPEIYLTGYETSEEMDSAISNTYAKDQMSVIYVGKADKVRVIINSRGIFKDNLDELTKNFKKSMFNVQNIVCKTAIALQMNAIDSLKSVQMCAKKEKFSLILHAGAGAKMLLQNEVKDIIEFSLKAALSVGIDSLRNGDNALDAVEKVVCALENCFLFNAGKGSVFNEEKKHELEACLIDGTNKRAGSVACITNVKNPIRAARLVMEDSPHCFIIGSNAEKLAREKNLSLVENSSFDTKFRLREFDLDIAKNHTQTVGALALDVYGNLAAASSTGGTMKKSLGRISDTSIVGAGIYCDDKIGIACSGNGEIFIRNSIASKIASVYNFKNTSLNEACSQVLDQEIGSSFGGAIAISSKGEISVYSRAEAMFISSYDGINPKVEILETTKLEDNLKPPKSWLKPNLHAEIALTHPWYHMIFDIQNTLYHSTVDFFHTIQNYYYVITPITTQTISSPMGLGSDSQPVSVNLGGDSVYLADSMQFALEYFLRFKHRLNGTYYISSSFRGESPDSTHLNQFYHVECELLGDLDAAISVAERYIVHLSKEMLSKHSSIIAKAAGSVAHLQKLIEKFQEKKQFPRVKLDDAIAMMQVRDEFCELVVEGKPEFGYKLKRKGERYLIEKFDGPVWLTDMDHLGVPFYQAYADNEKKKAKAADLLLGLGETLGLGERHETAQEVQEALAHHKVDENSYDWYVNMRRVKALKTSGWGMGTERYLCWLLNKDDVRDMHVIPRMNGMKFLP